MQGFHAIVLVLAIASKLMIIQDSSNLKRLVKNKLKCLGNLLGNYSGLDEIKDDFTKMLYASSLKNGTLNRSSKH